MATVALATAGAWLAKTALGESFKFLGVSAAGWGWLAGSLLGSALFGPKIPTQYGPRISDLKAPSGSYGVAIPKVFGTVKLAGRFIWASDIREVKIVKTYKKKAFFGLVKKKYKVVTYEYYADFAVAFCEGPVTSVRRIWFDQKVVYDSSDKYISNVIASSKSSFSIYNGEETQLPDPYIEADKGVGNVSAYRGMCYAVFNNINLKKYGNRIPAVSAEVVVSATPSYLVAQTAVDWPDYSSGVEHNKYFDKPEQNGFIRFMGRTTNYTTYGECVEFGYTYNGIKIYEKLHVFHGNFFGYGAAGVYQINPARRSDKYAAGIIGQSGYGNNPVIFERTGDNTWMNDAPISGLPISENIESVLVDIDYFLLGILGPEQNEKDWIVKIDKTQLNQVSASYNPTNAVGANRGVVRDIYYDEYQGRIFIYTDYFDGVSYYNYIQELDDSLNLIKEWSVPYQAWAGIIVNGDAAIISSGTSPSYSIVQLNDDGSSTIIDSGTVSSSYTQSLHPIALPPYLMVQRTAYISMNPLFGAISGFPIDQIISSVSAEVGFTSADFDYSQLSSLSVDGYALSRPMTARAAIETLAQAFFFDMVESDGKLKAIPRGSSPSISISSNDMIPEGDDKTELETTIVQELELPYRVEVGYIQKDKYQTGLQHASRPDKADDITNKYQIELAIVMDDNKAAQVAEVLLYDLWTAKNRVIFSVPYKYVELDPGDVINLSVNGSTRTIRITRIGYEASSLRVEGVYENPSIYNPIKQGGSSLGQLVETVGLDAPTEAQLLDVPILQDTDDDAGFYFAGAPLGDSSEWSGSELYVSDDGASWSGVGFVDSAVPIGYTENVLGDGPTTIWDDGNTLTVRIYSGTLNSATDIDVLNGQNYLLVGNEIIQFGDAVQNADGTYTLSRLLRGRKGTEWATTGHAQYERVVLLDRASLDRVVYSSTYLNVKRLYRAPSVGQSVLDASQFEFTNTAIGLKPYAPVYLKAEDAGGGNYNVTWIRRTRVGGEWNDLIDVPLGEESEQYVVEVWRAGSMVSSTTVTTTSATVAAQPGDTIQVAQVSAIVGNGYYVSITI